MLTSKTKHEDYKNWTAKMDAVTLAFRKGKLTLEEKTRLGDNIGRAFLGKIAPEDFHFFKDELSFRNYLRQIEPNPEVIEETIKHEREHFEAAERLKAQPVYAVFCFYREHRFGKREYGYQPFVRALAARPEDATAIIAAPTDLSEDDKRILQ